MLRVYTRVLLGVYARGTRARGSDGGQTGMVTALQRAGGALSATSTRPRLVLALRSDGGATHIQCPIAMM